MKPVTTISMFIATVVLVATASAATVDAGLSTREAFVGMPLTLQISISDATNYDQPTLPQIDGCDIRSSGAPSQSSQVTIINGRRTERRSVTLRYLITPRREGAFEIPALKMVVDGRSLSTQPIRFVATKSVTGDLLFVKIEGSKERVFVGEPLDLTLKIWIKPYRDAERNRTLSEGDMWNMISDQTSWGGFSDRMRELTENNQRPGGVEVLRDDGKGSERSYYLYEIDATVYPKRPGKIDADDVQVVVNYPTSLSTSRSPFDSFFGHDPLGHDPFGGSSPLSRMMDDDFFGSPFGNGLSVASTRPIVGDVSVGATEVVPVPTSGRPADYRGAVGRYNIVTQATPTTVDAGDPITLNIGIAGDGPMELVQAPPLTELKSLTTDFMVEDQSLAGFVQGESKVFATTIRPRREGITHIPSIPFSFFDPVKEKFQTVMSDPIAVTVNKSETLALDAIVHASKSGDAQASVTIAIAKSGLPDFTNRGGSSLLVSHFASTESVWWWVFVIIPPFVWTAAVVTRHRHSVVDFFSSFRSAHQRCLKSIARASNGSAMAAAVAQYISRRSGKPCPGVTNAIGVLRVSGLYDVAVEAESYLQSVEPVDFSVLPPSLTERYRQRAYELVARIDTAFRSMKKSSIRLSKTGPRRTAIRTVAHRTLVLVFAVAMAACSASQVVAADTASQSSADTVRLKPSQQNAILQEATLAYSQASDVAATDSAQAKQLFDAAARKYELLVDSGIRNSQLYLNLGNAYMQVGELGRAIVNYERARQLDPGNRQLLVNLQFANSKVEGLPAKATSETASTSWPTIMQQARAWNASLVTAIGLWPVLVCIAIGSLLFWGLSIARAVGYRNSVWRLAVAPLLLLLVSLGSYHLATTETQLSGNAVIVANNVQLHAGDGEQFDEVVTLDEAQGHRVNVLATRGPWAQIRTVHGHTGWVHRQDVEQVRG
jgi:tetratricopeptide (TPR) repeat protein